MATMATTTAGNPLAMAIKAIAEATVVPANQGTTARTTPLCGDAVDAVDAVVQWIAVGAWIAEVAPIVIATIVTIAIIAMTVATVVDVAPRGEHAADVEVLAVEVTTTAVEEMRMERSAGKTPNLSNRFVI